VNRNVITDRDVATGQAGNPIVLDAHTLITPSARDRAVLLGIPIVERGASAPGANAGGTGSAACAGNAGGGCTSCGRASCEGCEHAGTCSSRVARGLHGTNTSAIPDGLADGLYLVRIEGGRPTSVLPATGPGRMARRS